jgi:hypothetical protein
MKSVLIDIDHTISNAFWRDNMIGISTWDEYHNASEADAPLHDVAGLIRRLHGHYILIGLTARPEKFRSMTMKWCLRHDIPLDELLMRDYDNYESATKTKAELIRQRFVSPTMEIAFALEDREDCCTMLRGLGITVLQVFGRRI